MINILIVDDNESIRNLLSHKMGKEGYNILEGENGEEALDLVFSRSIDLIILDIMMPKLNGFDFMKNLRDAKLDIPVLMITADENFESKVTGFKLGVDDYLTKPLNMEEVSLRVSSLLRRAKINRAKLITIGDTTLNEETLELCHGEKIVTFAKKEFQLLYLLLSYPNKIFTRQNLLERIWEDADTIDRTVDVHINRIREKTVDITDFKITTVKGLGYKAEVKK